MIKISKKDYNTLMANLCYFERELEKERFERERVELLLQKSIEENIELKKFKNKMISLLNGKGNKL